MTVQRLGRRLGVDWDRELFGPKDLAAGIARETERWPELATDREAAARIALDRLRQDHRYYDPRAGLAALERRSERADEAAERVRRVCRRRAQRRWITAA